MRAFIAVRDRANGKGIDHFPEVYGQQLFMAYCENASGVPAGTVCASV